MAAAAGMREGSPAVVTLAGRVSAAEAGRADLRRVMAPHFAARDIIQE